VKIGYTLAIVREQPEGVTVRRIRPWDEYSLERWLFLLFVFTASSSACAMILLAILRPLFSAGAQTLLQGSVVGAASVLPLVALQFLRFFGKDSWLLRREVRQQAH
jgi:hypothetical protein